MLNDHPRQQLRFIITQYGQTVCHNAKRCEALLRDFCPEHKRELNLLIAALKLVNRYRCLGLRLAKDA